MRYMTQKAALKFLTLNCWGLPFYTPQRKMRFRAITAFLKSNNWDVVALQEVWLKSDREWLGHV
jgi:sphingomyelin phosphodiesterase 2